MKILMKKRSFVKVEMAGLLGVKVPCLMPNRVKGTSINDVPCFLAFFDLPTYLCPIWSLLEKAAYLMTSFFV